jgi:putative transcriptional regulator
MKKELFEDLVESIQEAGKIKKGLLKPSRVFDYKAVDVKRVRNKLHVSQGQFALMIGVSKATLQNWEQGRRKPEGPAKALLRVVEKKPKAVLEALQA